MSGNLWMFSDMLDDEDIEMQKHDFITLYQGADYYGLGLKVFTRMAREAGSVYKIGKKALIRRTIFDEYLRKVYKKELEKNSSDDSGKELMKRQGTMVTDEDSGRMDIRFGLLDYYGGLHCGECLDVLCDALIYSTRRQANETTYDVTPYTAEQDDTDIELGIAIDQALDKAKLDAPPSTVKGIDAIRLMSEGYTCREIGEQIGATDKQVAAMVSKARKFLKSRKDVLDLAGNI